MQMLLLRSNRVFKDTLELEPTKGTIRELTSQNKTGAAVKINGFFDKLDGTLVAIYAFSGHLYLRIGEKSIKIINEISVSATGSAQNRRLTVSDDSGELASVTYAIESVSISETDPTPFMENEDFDFGLFVSNVVSNVERKRVVLESW